MSKISYSAFIAAVLCTSGAAGQTAPDRGNRIASMAGSGPVVAKELGEQVSVPLALSSPLTYSRIAPVDGSNWATRFVHTLGVAAAVEVLGPT